MSSNDKYIDVYIEESASYADELTSSEIVFLHNLVEKRELLTDVFLYAATLVDIGGPDTLRDLRKILDFLGSPFEAQSE